MAEDTFGAGLTAPAVRDAAVRHALDLLDLVQGRCLDLQRHLGDGAWGPSQDVDGPHAAAVSTAAVRALQQLSDHAIADHELAIRAAGDPGTAADPWRGWFRPDRRHPWRAVVSADTQAGAWAKLLDYPLSGDRTVSQRDPNREGRPR